MPCTPCLSRTPMHQLQFESKPASGSGKSWCCHQRLRECDRHTSPSLWNSPKRKYQDIDHISRSHQSPNQSEVDEPSLRRNLMSNTCKCRWRSQKGLRDSGNQILALHEHCTCPIHTFREKVFHYYSGWETLIVQKPWQPLILKWEVLNYWTQKGQFVRRKRPCCCFATREATTEEIKGPWRSEKKHDNFSSRKHWCS